MRRNLFGGGLRADAVGVARDRTGKQVALMASDPEDRPSAEDILQSASAWLLIDTGGSLQFHLSGTSKTFAS